MRTSQRHNIRIKLVVVFVGVACAGSLLGGCLSPSDPRALRTVDMPTQWLGATDPSEAPAASRWWTAFGDATLTQLIDEALATNNDLAVAAIRVRRARLRAGLTNTHALSSEANAGADITRKFDEPAVGRFAYANASLSYELDLWGKLAAQRNEAAWKAQASEADREAAALALIGTTANLYWQIGNLNELIALGEANIADAERMVGLATARHRAGKTSTLDVAQAGETLAEQRAEQTGLLREREAKRNAFAILFDRPPERRAGETADLSAVSLPPIGAGLPAALLARRPDLRAAEFRLRALLANVDAARASFYPSLTLTGALGTSSDVLEHTLQSPVAALGFGLALPFLQWRTVRLKVGVAQSEYDEAVTEFRQTLYRAFADVEDALSARVQLDAEALQRERSVGEARRAAALAEARFRAGKTSLEPWLETGRTLRRALTTTATNRLARLESRMNLYLALGGGES